MTDWFKSFGALGAGFVVVVAATLGLADVILPPPAGSAEGPVPTASDAAGGGEVPAEDALPRLGGTLTVSGDAEGTFTLTRESVEAIYSLVGDQGRIVFEGRPLTVSQLSWEGWQFFPDPEACSITGGAFNSRAGVVAAELECRDLEEIRDKGVISLAGTMGIPADLLGVRGDLPAAGGSVTVGDETWEFAEAMLLAWQLPSIEGINEYNLRLFDEEREAALNFGYDHRTHNIWLASVERDGTAVEAPDDACEFGSQTLGRSNPRTTVLELSIDCAEVEIPGTGPAAVSGTVVVDQIELPLP